MHIITLKRLNEFAERHPETKSALQHWYKQAKTNNFRSFAETRETFGSADQDGKLTVLRYRRLKPLKDELEGLLARIGKMEKRKEELESMLADTRTYGDANQARSAGSEHREIAPAIDALYQQWAVVQEKIDGIEGEDPGVLEA